MTKDAHAERPRRSSTTCSAPTASSSSPTGATARSTRRCSRTNKAKFPDPAKVVDHRRPRRLGEGQRRALRSGERLDRQDRGRRGGLDRRSERGRRHPSHRVAGAPPARGLGGAGALGLGRLDAVAEPDRAAAAGGGRRRARPRAARTRSGTRSRAAQAVGGAAASRCWSSLLVAADQRGHRHADRLGARPRRVPRQARRQRADRPAVRAADDRRRPHAARALRAESPVGIDIAFTQAARAAGAAVRDAAVRRARGAAGAASSSTARWRRPRPRSARRRCTIFRRIILPEPRARRSCRGAALAFARAVGEFGSVVLISRQHAVRHPGRVGLHLQADRERQPDRRRGGVGRAAR